MTSCERGEIRDNCRPGTPAQNDVTCDGADDDCDGGTDEDALQSTWYRDADRDGYGCDLETQVACVQPAGFVAMGSDCNDATALVSPGGLETCDGVDEDCDTAIDDGVGCTRACLLPGKRGSDQTLSDRFVHGGLASVWTGDELGVVYCSGGADVTLTFLRVDPSGLVYPSTLMPNRWRAVGGPSPLFGREASMELLGLAPERNFTSDGTRYSEYRSSPRSD